MSSLSSSSTALATSSAEGSASSTISEPYRILLDVSIAKSRKVRGGNYVQLATVTSKGLPKCRTIVQRGLFSHQGQSVLKFITDHRSQKITQIQHSPKGELVWWFLKSSEQYRIGGELTLVGNDSNDKALLAVRKQTWGQLRDTAREQFYWPQPGVPLDEDKDNEVKLENQDGGGNDGSIPTGGRGEDGKVLPPPDTFLLMLLWPETVDYLRLSDNARVTFEREDSSWKQQSVSP